MTTLTEFLLERIAEDEAVARGDGGNEMFVAYVEGYGDYALVGADRLKAECEAKRRIVEAHRDWPVLVTTPPKLETGDGFDSTAMTMRMTQEIEWRTQEEYRAKFGDEPPTAPMILALAMVYSSHPDFRDEWR